MEQNDTRYLLELDHAELWNLTEIIQETIRTNDYEVVDTLEQKLIDLLYQQGKARTVVVAS